MSKRMKKIKICCKNPLSFLIRVNTTQMLLILIQKSQKQHIYIKLYFLLTKTCFLMNIAFSNRAVNHQFNQFNFSFFICLHSILEPIYKYESHQPLIQFTSNKKIMIYGIRNQQGVVQIYKMNLVTNYSAILLNQWEQTANIACFEINQQAKTQAEFFFYMFLQTPNQQLFLDLINQGSETLLFVLFSCSMKAADFFGKSIKSFILLVQNIQTWELKGFTFVRKNGVPLQEYVTRTIMLSLGTLLKILYKPQQTQETIMNCLSEMPNSYFKLYLLRSFIEAIQVIDYEMGYMRHRLMVYHFQDNIIPFICDVLMPFFYKVQENIEINELSYLQQKMAVHEDNFESSQQKLQLLTKEQEIQANYIFLLLKSVIEFNYNITYNEYQNVQEAHLVTFPDKVIQKIITPQFLKAFFFIIQQISSTKMGNIKNDYLLIGVNCLSRMMQSRLSTLQAPIKEAYIIQFVKGISIFFSKCLYNGNAAVLQGALACNKNLFIGCQLSFIKATIVKHLNGLQVYHNYIKDLTSIILEILKNSSIQYQNSLLFEALETANKILLNYGNQEIESMDQEAHYIVNFAQTIVDRFLQNLCIQRRLFPSSNLINIHENKTIVSQLFEFFKRLGTYNYQFLFCKLEAKVDHFINNMHGQVVVLANFLFLLSQIVQKNFLERTQYLHKANNNDLAILGRIVNKCTQLVKYYMNTRKVYFKKEATYIDLAVILFTEAMMGELLANFQCVNSIKIKNKLYFHMVYQKSDVEMWNPITDTKSQEILFNYLNILLNFLEGCMIANKEDEVKMLYVLEVVQKGIFKLKWNSKRQVYLKTGVFQLLQNFFSCFFKQFQHMTSIRRRTAQIIVSLTFDDILDEYKLRICKFINIVKAQPLVSILYDLIGAFQGIENYTVSKYFYSRLKKEIKLNFFFDSIFELAYKEHNQILFKDGCHLIKSMVNNKGLRVNNNIQTYEIFAMVLNNLIEIVTQIHRNASKQMDFWCDSLCQILEMVNEIINGTHINIYAMDQATQISPKNTQLSSFSSKSQEFIYQLLLSIIKIVPNTAKQYPRLQQLVLLFYCSIYKNIFSYIIGDNSEKLIHQFAIFHFKLIDLIIQYMKEVLAGSKYQEEKLTRSIDIVRFFYSYTSKQSKFVHQKTILGNLQKIYKTITNSQAKQNKHQILIFYSLSFILTNYKNNLCILRPIAKILYWTSKLFKTVILDSLVKLTISAYMVGQFENILGKPDLSEDGFVEEFKQWVKRSDQY